MAEYEVSVRPSTDAGNAVGFGADDGLYVSDQPSFPLLLPDGTATAPSLAFESDPTRGLYFDGTTAAFVGQTRPLAVRAPAAATLEIASNAFGDGNSQGGLSLLHGEVPYWDFRKLVDGGATGGDLAIRRRDDTGTPTGIPIRISRATGDVTLESGLVLGISTDAGNAIVQGSDDRLYVPVAPPQNLISADADNLLTVGSDGLLFVGAAAVPPPAPTITGIDPDNGPVAGGTVVTITGTAFTGATGVTFGTVAGTEFSVVSATEITVTTPAGTAGPVGVTVLHPSGNAVEPQGFTYAEAAVETVQVMPPNSNIGPGGTVQLIAVPRDGGGTALPGRPVVWQSIDPGNATVDGNGLVTGVAIGHATITATVEGKTGIADVTVGPPAATVEVTPEEAAIGVDDTVQLTAVARDSGGTELPGRVVQWSSEDMFIASVNQNGLVTAHAGGFTVTITATSDDGPSGSAEITTFG